MQKRKTDLLNTPKSGNLIPLFDRLLGIENISTFWNRTDVSIIDKFVSDRGDIAHNGNQSNVITIDELGEYIDVISEAAIDTDGNMADLLMISAFQTVLPWEKVYSTRILGYINNQMTS